MSATTTTDFGSALAAAIQGGYLARLDGGTYAISSPIVIHVSSTIQGALGIDGGGATLVSQVTNGQPLIQIIVDPGVDFRYLTLSNFNIVGNGREGDGIQIVCATNDSWVYNWSIANVTVEHVGGYGLDMQGSVFEGMIRDSWMNNNGRGGARFAHHADGGQASALRWFGGGAANNDGAGITLDNGARDISVDGAAFSGNDGAGISAPTGITAVTNSAFEDNRGPGVRFQNYGNFTGNTFSTSGVQTVGISGYLAGNATLIDNVSTYTGTGPDPTRLADLQGNGGAFLAGDDGLVMAGSGIAVSDASGGNLAHVSVSSEGVALPELASVTGATTMATADSTGTGAVESALDATIADNSIIHRSDVDNYTVTSPIVINVTRSTSGPIGIDLGGAKIWSQIADGSPVIEIIVGPGVDVGSLTLSNFSISGNSREGDGIKIVADGWDRSIGNLTVNNVNIEHVGGIGLDVLGNVSQGRVFNSWMHGNDQGGARFANGPAGGTASGLEWEGGGFRKNGGAGLILDNGTHDMTVKGAYFVDNYGPGLVATSGISLVTESGFENNQGAGAIVHGPASFVDDSFSTWGTQKVGVGGSLAGGQIDLVGNGPEYYGPGADPTVLANVQGTGTLAIVGGGNVVVGPDVTVSGGEAIDGSGSDQGSTIYGDDAANVLSGAGGNDTLYGGDGDDVLVGGIGADRLIGGNGRDRAQYSDAKTGVTADLMKPDVNAGIAAGDTYSSVENLRGSAYADILRGDGGNNKLCGSGGGDKLYGRSGKDRLDGGEGNDVLIGGAGADRLTGGAGNDTVAYRAVSDSAPDAADILTDFHHGVDRIDFNVAAIDAGGDAPHFQGNITGGGNLTLNPYSLAYLEVGGNTHLLVNTTGAAESVTLADTHAADMKIVLLGVDLGLGASDFS